MRKSKSPADIIHVVGADAEPDSDGAIIYPQTLCLHYLRDIPKRFFCQVSPKGGVKKNRFEPTRPSSLEQECKGPRYFAILCCQGRALET